MPDRRPEVKSSATNTPDREKSLHAIGVVECVRFFTPRTKGLTVSLTSICFGTGRPASRETCFADRSIRKSPRTAAMARAFAAAYKGLPWQAVYINPMKRTVATATPLCKALKLDMQRAMA